MKIWTSIKKKLKDNPEAVQETLYWTTIATIVGGTVALFVYAYKADVEEYKRQAEEEEAFQAWKLEQNLAGRMILRTESGSYLALDPTKPLISE